ncbi:hypothetical protein A3H85_00730 [Candidatus Daviesbacteria bacterium RIFCSPLOWO2_02_FULL_40_8]|uniref:Uncharacterized protein n=1 Tax=Candidatus Daviesbacteria bacterium RIFCSPLOWO2_01_FULL_40_24 TaxID=1797787 RepID=A0A1F5MK56_9BACT|nr:MAG: hypothetical protein A2780_01945 [Candidatus Daviesbacteria bacterium RIFCSPHIGHO2_01_FULL_41_45]OGE34865.1 MAG: hypothetical protein A3C32_01715 [Candidatus Daviesbacteria bacterium RIFCSPHIGHO2_02_FULL_41_14]OGE65766.1 MAG: hypothetical protein A3B49_00060 [Candidatus Daviesbacteria bacterium RIFCSPLOWO2_01_FULL_40_24]OGE67088.1 MAG: hypothetical protein A3H85_00730 [Candidatus Daviesbacteria bacterium RIFCSPLOWO2_02_FULL_40_8]
MTNEDLESIRGIIQSELEPIKETLEQHTGILAQHTGILEQHTQKLDALTADVIDLQDTTKAIWDKLSLLEEKQNSEINEIRTHVGLVANSETL